MVFAREIHCQIVDILAMVLPAVRKAYPELARASRAHNSPRVALFLCSPGYHQDWNCVWTLHPLLPYPVAADVSLILLPWKLHILGNLCETEKAGTRNLHISWLGQPPSWVTTPAIDIPNTITNCPYRRKETRRSIGNSSCILMTEHSLTVPTWACGISRRVAPSCFQRARALVFSLKEGYTLGQHCKSGKAT